MFLTRREPGVPLSLFRPYPLPFSRPFLLYCSLPFLFFYVFFIDLYLLLFPGRHSICCFPHCSHMFLTRREPGVPLSLFRSYLFPFLLLFFYIVPYPSFSSMSFSLIYICCSFRGGILSVVFPAVAICFWPAWNLECPCLFSDLILFPFLLLFFYIVPYPSFFFYVFFIDLYLLLFPGRHSICWLSAVFPHCRHMFLTRREPAVPSSLFRPYPLPFSPPFLLYCSLPFLFPVLLCLFHWSISAVVSGEAFYLLFSPL